MPDTFTERHDLAEAHAAERNSAIFPNIIASVQDNFGIAETPVYIYNVGPQTFNAPRPPNHPHLFIRGCPTDKPYLLVGQITHPFREIEYDQNGAQTVRLTDGYREATRMLSPLNPGTDQNFDAPDAFNVGGNLNEYGCFWSTHNPPLDSEVEAARKRMERAYRRELEKLASIEAKNPNDARDAANDTSHAAANYFGVSTSWHRSDLVPKDADRGKVDCAICGEKIHPSAKLCVHCGAPTDPDTQDAWLAARLGVTPARPERRR